VAQKIKLYLDEDIDPLLTKVLRDRGYDILSTHEAKMHKSDDYKQIDFAISEGRAILTHNVRDFHRIAKEYGRISKSHSGIILSSQLPFKELLKRVLRLLHKHNSEDIPNQVLWLEDFK
jgi:predicted nuclease of predicted toxin-antitoxin system